MAEFDWWLLVLGLVVGGGLVYLVLAESARRDADLEVDELEAEASFISERLGDVGLDVSQPEIAEVLREHRAYLRLPPPDAIVTDPDEVPEPAADPNPRPRVPATPTVFAPPDATASEPAEPRPPREART